MAPYQQAMYALVQSMENESHTIDVQMEHSLALSHNPAAMKLDHPLTLVFKSGTRCVQMGALIGFSSKFVKLLTLHHLNMQLIRKGSTFTRGHWNDGMRK